MKLECRSKIALETGTKYNSRLFLTSGLGGGEAVYLWLAHYDVVAVHQFTDYQCSATQNPIDFQVAILYFEAPLDNRPVFRPKLLSINLELCTYFLLVEQKHPVLQTATVECSHRTLNSTQSILFPGYQTVKQQVKWSIEWLGDVNHSISKVLASSAKKKKMPMFSTCNELLVALPPKAIARQEVTYRKFRV